jgi:spore coat protein U-like protein
MSLGPSRLGYRLYLDAGRTQPWGDSFASGLVVSNTKNNLNVPVYGRIPAGQLVTPGAYSDTVIVSIDY